MDLFLALLSAFAFALGNVLQKVGLSRLSGPGPIWRETLQSAFWWYGMGTTAFAVLLSYWVTAHASLSVVQPIICLNPLLSVFFARFLMGEPIQGTHMRSLTFLFLGLLCFAWSPSDDGLRNANYLLFVLVLSALGGLLAFAGLANDLKWSLLAGLGFALSPVLYKGVIAELGAGGFQLEWSGLFALLHSPSLLPFIAVYVFSFIASQIALYHGKVSLVVPVSAGLGALGAALAGLVVFDEVLNAPKVIALVLLALALFSYKENSNSKTIG